MGWFFNKKPEEVLAVHRHMLFGENKEGFFDGFIPKKSSEYEDRIFDNSVFLLRKTTSNEQKLPAENDETFKQIIPYAVLKQGDKFFVYKRTNKGNEERLHEKYSLGVGGHINPINMREMNKLIQRNDMSILDHGMIKELEEEIRHKEEELEYKIIGFINHEGNEVARVHFGVVYLINLKNDVEVREKHKLEGKMMTRDEINKIQDKFEDWSKFVWRQIMFDNQF
jgi:predicted NUDIX family phosphoesterase